MRRYENLLYLFIGIGLGMLLTASLTKKEIEKVYELVEIPKVGDMSDCANEREKSYYEHLTKTK
jgi:hypothetical protein